MVKLATPVSHLFENKEWGNQIIEASDVLECRDRTFKNNDGHQELFHSDFQPIHEVSDKFFKYLENIRATKPNLKLVSFHMASSCDRPKLKNKMYMPGGRNYSRDDLLKNAHNNFSIIKNIFGSSIKIAVENNNYYPTPAYEHITQPDFINDVLIDNNLFLLFDIAHAKVTCHNKKINYIDYCNQLHLKKAIQLHVCKPGNFEDLKYDAHELPDNEITDELINLIKEFNNIEYVTLEYYKNIDFLIPELQRIKALIN